MDVDPAAAFLPADSPFDSGPSSYAAFNATDSKSYGPPRSRACSTASSVNSFASSAFSTWTPQTSAHGRPSLEGTLATKLAPSCTGEGFVVDAGLAGQVEVGWQELVDLLVDRECVFRQARGPRSLLALFDQQRRLRLFTRSTSSPKPPPTCEVRARLDRFGELS